MGIILKVYKDGKEIINLSEHCIQNIKFYTISDKKGNFHFPVILREINITGLIKGNSINEPYTKINEFGESEEIIREIDSVRKLINWAALPADIDYCMNIIVTISDSAGVTVKEDIFIDVFPYSYTEKFRDTMGAGEFCVVLREMMCEETVEYNLEGIIKATDGKTQLVW